MSRAWLVLPFGRPLERVEWGFAESVALEAECDPRTVIRTMTGKRVRREVGERIVETLRAYGVRPMAGLPAVPPGGWPRPRPAAPPPPETPRRGPKPPARMRLTSRDFALWTRRVARRGVRA